MDPVLLPVAPGITAIDTFYGGRERYTAAYLLEGSEPCLIETGPTTSHDHVVAGLAGLGISPSDLAHVVVTHIHLDHAGGVGAIARTFPRAKVHVHVAGARHLAEPERLVSSATRIYGAERMASLFGPVIPVPSDRIHALDDGDRLEFGGRTLRVMATPGHAKHQVALVDEATGAVFTGDALGIHPPDLPVLRPATPPPDYDLEAAIRSIEHIREAAHPGGLLLFAHFGPIREIDRICELAASRFTAWTEAAGREIDRGGDLDSVVAILEAEALRDISTGAGAPIDIDRLETLSSIRMNAQGIMRYWELRRAREAGEGVAD